MATSDLGDGNRWPLPPGLRCASHAEFLWEGSVSKVQAPRQLQAQAFRAQGRGGLRAPTGPFRTSCPPSPSVSWWLHSFYSVISLLHVHSRFCLCLSVSLPLSQSLLLPTSPSLIGTRVRETLREEPYQSLRDFLEKEFGQRCSLPPPLVLKLPITSL